ncbi:MAG: tRNA (adenosine(37)-N6)-threonylcarbamoyltransferase complex transferase subunit TsaD [Desulfosarcinaceae bacterium]|jgi:N6-L-threonylcarbamoyladenine synthase
MNILGIESSCDETAAAVVADGCRQKSSVVASQVAVHHPYGGVVPELASRRHVEAIVPVVAEALKDADLTPGQLDGVAATQGPGLVGSLLVGFSFAKAYAYARDLPFVGVNHLEGHIHSVFLGQDPPTYPFVALLVSGGHTSLYYVSDPMNHELMGQTRDDAVGEAYDKVAKMMGLGYPGGRVIDDLAADGDAERIRFPRVYLDKAAFDFSFSGIKTAVNRHLQTHADTLPEGAADIAAGFQAAVVEVLTYKLVQAARERRCRQVAIVGGVAANHGLRESVRTAAAEAGLKLHIPAVDLCGDNAAMIAAVGYHYLEAGERTGLDADVYSRVALSPSAVG